MHTRLTVVVALGVSFAVQSAHADTTFGPGSLIIPASASYQTDCGAVSMYGLAYDILRANASLPNKIEVYYAYRSDKASPNRCTPTNLHVGPSYPGATPTPIRHDHPKWNDGCDFEIRETDPTLPPVRLLNNVTGGESSFATINLTSKTSGGTAVYPNWGSVTVQQTSSAATDVNIIRYYGGSFVISDDDAPTLISLIRGTRTATDASGSVVDFTPFRNVACTYGTTIGGTVNIHVAKVAFTAPTPRIFDSTPPRLALLARNANQSPADGNVYTTTPGTNSYTGRVADNILQEYLKRAGLDFTGAQGCPPTGYLATTYPAMCPASGRGQIYDLFDFRDIVNGRLADTSAGKPVYKMFWAPHWEIDGSSMNAREQAGVAAIASFLDGRGGMMAQCASVESFEGVAAGWRAPAAANPLGQFQTCKSAGTSCASTSLAYGLEKNTGGSLASSPTGILLNCSDPTRVDGDACVYYSFPGDPFAQVAEYRWDSSAYSLGSHVADWRPATSSMYRPGVAPLISGVTSLQRSKLGSPASARSMITGDFATRSYKDNDPLKSNILYVGNHDLSTSVAGTKVILQTLLQLGEPAPPPVMREVSRSSPITALLGSTPALVQGSFESTVPPPTTPQVRYDSDAASFTYPYQPGHVRAVPVLGLSTSATGYSSLSAIFDAASGMSTTRTIFTNIGTGGLATVNQRTFDATNTGTLLGPDLTSTTRSTIAARVRAGISNGATPPTYSARLGGVDRSTVAVIEPSLVAGSPTRPKIVYFGATDGMLHAVCAETVTGCTQGRELWAFIPRVNLPRLRYNAARVDGSPRVVDLYGDFDGDGRRAFHTILLFHTGTGTATTPGETPAVYALDVTDPTNPRVLWEYTTPSTRTAVELGVGLTISTGQIRVGAASKHAAFVQTNNGGTGGPGSVVTAIDIETGAKIWQTNSTVSLYPAPRVAASGTVPPAGIPGGAVAYAFTDNGFVDNVLVGTLYGDLWLLDASTGANRHGANPLFRFSADKKPFGAPPAIYLQGNSFYAIAVSGGYADPAALTLWSGTQHQVVAVSLGTATARTPLNESAGPPAVPFVRDLPAGDRGYAQPVVIGGEIYVTSDSEDINQVAYGTDSVESGHLTRMNLDGTGATTIAVAGGAGSVGSFDTMVFSASADKVQRTSALDATRPTGSSKLHIGLAPSVTRKLWLRSQ